MNRHLPFHAMLLLLPILAGCQPSDTPQAPASGSTTSADAAPRTALGRTVDKALREAREELRSGNISISDGVHVNINGREIRRPDGLPKAEITPQGDLLIADQPVAVNAAQRAMLLEYRGHIIAVAEAGMAIGMQGADLAAQAMGEAVKGIFSGKSEQDIERSVEAQAGGIEASVAKLCGQLPAMMASQEKLAAALPAFKPYATMTAQDIEDCQDGHDDPNVQRAEVRQEIREKIREGIRGGIRKSVRAAVGGESADAQRELSAAEEAEAATR